MKKEYLSPELEVVRFTLADVLSASPTDIVSIQENDDTSLPDDDDELGVL